MMRGSWHPPMRGYDLVLVTGTHAGVWIVLTTAVVLAVHQAELGPVGVIIFTVPASLGSMWLGYRVAGRVASWRVQLRLVRALRREQR